MFNMMLVTLMFTYALLGNEATYVGDTKCATCHSKQTDKWISSHHAKAMMVANEASVAGDFNHTTFNYNGIITTFYKKDTRFMVQTDGPDGKLHDYEIAYTFGIYPLQQYLIKFPDGKMQVLDPTWDNRPKEQGGQRWYHIHHDDNVTANDPLHWTGPNMNWNYMCADCHSTNLKKNYDATTKQYHTTYDSINVSCEACHGPASEHLLWAKTDDANSTNYGLTIHWPKKKSLWREESTTLKKFIQEKELNVCAKCHSRRSQLDDNFVAGEKFHNHYLPANLDNGLYFSDGKIEDEVYVYNSFIQSRMYSEGVTCSDCHDPHSLKRKGEGDTVCFSCHASEIYTETSHHHHPKKSRGASCIACHMPARTYMGIDSRNDHSFRVPRPDISVVSPQIPNACNLCHTDKEASWSAQAMVKWYGKVPVGYQKFSHTLEALRNHRPNAPKALYSLLTSGTSTITKATLTTYLGNYPSKQTYITTLQMLRDTHPMVRCSALIALEAFPPRLRLKETFKMLYDPIKIVRIEAVRGLLSIPMGSLDEKRKKIYEKVLLEYQQTLDFTSERPETQLSIARLYESQGDLDKAEQAYQEALRLQPRFVPAYINYSHFLQRQGKEQASKQILEKGIEIVPNIAILHHTLGLWFIRAKEPKKAQYLLQKAMQLDRENSRFAYVYAVSVGEKNPQKAIEILQNSYTSHQGDISIVSALSYYYKQTGEEEKSLEFEKKASSLQHFSLD